MPDNNIISIDSLLYGNTFICVGKRYSIKAPDIFNKYNKDYIHNNQQLRNNIINDICKEYSDFIMNSPTVDYDFVVYRGIRENIDAKIGDILNNLGFMFTTFNIHYAEQFALKEDNKTYGVMFQINIPKGTHFHNHFLFNLSTMEYFNEIVLNHNHKLLVKDIQSIKNKYKLLICDLL